MSDSVRCPYCNQFVDLERPTQSGEYVATCPCCYRLLKVKAVVSAEYDVSEINERGYAYKSITDKCAKCGSLVEGEPMVVDGEKWCHKCYDELCTYLARWPLEAGGYI